MPGLVAHDLSGFHAILRREVYEQESRLVRFEEAYGGERIPDSSDMPLSAQQAIIHP